MVVAIDRSGLVVDSKISQSSGYRQLDAAALDIVNISSPFAPLPDELRAETDLLYITRTWEFSSNQLITRR